MSEFTEGAMQRTIAELQHDLGNERTKVQALERRLKKTEKELSMSTDFKELNVIAELREGNLYLREALAKATATAQHTGVEFAVELDQARRRFPTMASAHEGYAVILEELDEVWDIVKQKQTERDYAKLRKETVQLGAMVLAFLIEVVDTNNRR